MNNLEIIESLKKDLPETDAVIGYGSGIYKQTGYKEGEFPDKDVIIVVDDFKKFLIEDYEMNEHHFFRGFSKDKLKRKQENDSFYSNIGCLKFYHNNIHFKALIVSRKALEQDLKTWKFFGMAGRLTKPILYQKIPTDLEIAIEKNRQSILAVALLFNNADSLTPNDLYNTISSLTYLYDFRTILPGEKKSKATDIVSGAFDFFDRTYGQMDLVVRDKELIYNIHPVELIDQLPDNIKFYLLKHLNNCDLNNISKQDLERISKIIKTYFQRTNFVNSIRLAFSSSATLGTEETIKHGLSKVKRHFIK